MAEQDIKMDMKKILSDKGKEHVFNAFKEYIDAMIELKTPIITKELRELVEKRATKAEEELKAVIFALEWRHK